MIITDNIIIHLQIIQIPFVHWSDPSHMISSIMVITITITSTITITITRSCLLFVLL